MDELTSDKDGKKLGLDAFLAKNTSEDNASFGELMESASEKHRAKFAWLYDKEKEHAERREVQLAISNGEVAANKGEFESRPTLVESWGYKAKNALMYVPDGCDKSAEEKLQDSKAKPQEVRVPVFSLYLSLFFSPSLSLSLSSWSSFLITYFHLFRRRFYTRTLVFLAAFAKAKTPWVPPVWRRQRPAFSAESDLTFPARSMAWQPLHKLVATALWAHRR